MKLVDIASLDEAGRNLQRPNVSAKFGTCSTEAQVACGSSSILAAEMVAA